MGDGSSATEQPCLTLRPMGAPIPGGQVLVTKSGRSEHSDLGHSGVAHTHLADHMPQPPDIGGLGGQSVHILSS